MIEASVSYPWQMWAVMAIIAGGLALYMNRKVAIEFSAIAMLLGLMLLFHVAPPDIEQNNIQAMDFLLGFSNPALITVIALLILGEALERVGIFEVILLSLKSKQSRNFMILGLVLFMMMFFSAFMNNTPLVVIMIPIIRFLSVRAGRSASAFMMPLSFAAILGGMTTLIGSSTNLLVSAELASLGYEPLGFFDFLMPSGLIALVGFAYLLFIMPYMLPSSSPKQDVTPPTRLFRAHINITNDSRYIGIKPDGGDFQSIPEFQIISIRRGDEFFKRPFRDVSIQQGDLLVIQAHKTAISDLLNDKNEDIITEPNYNYSNDTQDVPSLWRKGQQMMVEAIIPRNSRFIHQTVRDIQFRFRYHCLVLGLDRKLNTMDDKLLDSPLKEGDVLLIQGSIKDIEQLRSHHDLVLMEWTSKHVKDTILSIKAVAIFLTTIALLATGLLPTALAAMLGAGAMVVFGIISLQDAARAMDLRIILVIASALAMGAALQATGGADFIALGFFGLLGGFEAPLVLSCLFIFIAVITNILSNNATAVLFTPIAVALAEGMNAPVELFAITVLIAANCSFASPIGYQTNLLVMGPGGYKFIDYVKAGTPLMVLCWLVFTFICYFIWPL